MNKTTKKITIAAALIAIGLLLPQVLHVFGNGLAGVISPLHIPAFFAGFLLGPIWGLGVGILVPLLSSVITGMPPLFPIGMAMMVEIGLYGLMSGLCNKKFNVWISLAIAIVVGRIGYVLAAAFLLQIFSFEGVVTSLIANFSGGFIAIIVQFAIIPVLVTRLKKVI